ncbi:MAG: hypothetical protein VKJ05_01980 [Synechococcaceae cyanobacterium]|nr:hypothetical protein [Synechococcaceae cyanobacterium]
MELFTAWSLPAPPWLLPAQALVAFLYAKVSHAGATGYSAVLALAAWKLLELQPPR